jgi:hypothetical protein
MSEDAPVPAPAPPPSIIPHKEFLGLSSPFGLIGAFTLVIEVALILAGIWIHDNTTRLVMLAFAAAAFFYVAHKFFWFLNNRPEVLYTPRDYGVIPTIEAYRDATNRTAVLAQHATTRVITATVAPMSAESNMEIEGTVVPGKDRSIVAEDKAKLEVTETVTVEKFNEGEYLTLVVEDEHRSVPYVSPDKIEKRGTETKPMRYDPIQWIGQFIIAASEAYKELGYFSTPESYGLTWVMRDRKTGTVLSDIGFVRSLGFGGAHTDYRRLFETEVLPGMELEPVALPPPEPPPIFPPTSPDEWLTPPAPKPGEVDSFDAFLRKRGIPSPRYKMPPGTRPPGT